MAKLFLLHGLLRLIGHSWNDPSMAWLRVVVGLAVLCYVLWLVSKFVLYIADKLRTWRRRSEMPYDQNPL